MDAAEAKKFAKELRQKLGMTQEQFAHALGITLGTVCRWEGGRFSPSKLARVNLLALARESKPGIPKEVTTTPCLYPM